MDKAKCRSCGAPILWVRSEKTLALMPLDAEPVPNGNIVILSGVARVFSGDFLDEMAPDNPRYQSHFASCPNAQQHRGKSTTTKEKANGKSKRAQ